jgi:beta-ketodecanoyl-[acyl-carrier-protein] synthase
MHRVCISSTGLYVPPFTISNAELVDTFNRFADLDNAAHATEIAQGTRTPVPHSSVEFIEKASGIHQRYVLEKSGVLDPARMRPRFAPRPDNALSLMAEIAVAAAQDALQQVGKSAADVDGVICASRQHAACLPGHGGRNPARAGRWWFWF